MYVFGFGWWAVGCMLRWVGSDTLAFKGLHSTCCKAVHLFFFRRGL